MDAFRVDRVKLVHIRAPSNKKKIVHILSSKVLWFQAGYQSKFRLQGLLIATKSTLRKTDHMTITIG